MANQPSPTVEELQLRKRARRRLIGAVTLVALMVTVLPMVLDDEPKPVGGNIAINIPSQQTPPPPAPTPPAPANEEHVTPAPTQPPAPAAVVKPTPPEAKPHPHPAPPKKPEKPAEKQPEKPRPAVDKPKETKPPEAKAAQHGGTQHVVLLGAFQSEANAKQRQAKLKELGIKFYTEKVKSPSGEKFAVRAGPYGDRQEAEHVLAKLKAAGIQDGMVAEKK